MEDYMKFLVLSTLIISIPAFAKTDYSKCKGQFNNFEMPDDPCAMMGMMDKKCLNRK